MGISRLTALTIQNRNVRCEAGGPTKDEGKYVGWVMLDVQRWHPLFSTQPIYDTKEEAVKAMEEIVEEIRKMDVLKAPPIEEEPPKEQDEEREMII